MTIIHTPQFDIAKVVKHYEEKDGVAIKYVCTSDITASDVPFDIFYRDTPHPEFGNRYFGLYLNTRTGNLMITGADKIEDLEFGLVADSVGDLHYSQTHHDYKVLDNGNMIDGGRAYIRTSNGADLYKVDNGEFVPVNTQSSNTVDNTNNVMSDN